MPQQRRGEGGIAENVEGSERIRNAAGVVRSNTGLSQRSFKLTTVIAAVQKIARRSRSQGEANQAEIAGYVCKDAGSGAASAFTVK